MNNIDFYKLDIQIDGRDIILSNGYIPLHNEKNDIVVAGLFVEMNEKLTFDSCVPKREMFDGTGVYPLLAVGFDADHAKGIRVSKAKYIYDTDLNLLLNEGIVSSTTIQRFIVGKKHVGPDSPDYTFAKSVHETGHALVGYLQAGDQKLKGSVSMSGHSSITGNHDRTTIEWAEIKIREALGGFVAENLFWDDHNNSRSDLIGAAHKIICLILDFGLLLVKHDRLVFDLPDGRPTVTAGTAVESMISYYITQTKKLLAGEKSLIMNLADNLIAEGELSAERFGELIGIFTE